MMKNVLVTGGLGYIGSVLTPLLRARGHAVTVRDYGLFDECTIGLGAPNEFILSDCRNFDEAWLEDIDTVVHLAAFSNDPTDRLHPEKLYPPSLAYSDQIAAACKKRGIRFIFASSCSVYGIASGPVTEESRVNPQTGYARNKYEVEQKLTALADATFRPIALRFGTVYGFSPRIRFDLVVNMFAGMAVTTGEVVLNSNGKSWRPHLHVEDAAGAIIAAVEAQESVLDPAINVFNVGHDDDNRMIIDIAKLVVARAKNGVIRMLNEVTPDNGTELIRDQNVRGGVDVRSYSVRFDKLAQLGYAAKWRLETGISALIENLNQVDLSAEQFRSPRYYRLPWTDLLVKQGKLTDDLNWSK